MSAPEPSISGNIVQPVFARPMRGIRKPLPYGAVDTSAFTHPKFWSEDEDRKLCEAIGEGASFAEAGALIGRNKNMCIGRFHRLIAKLDGQGS